jgi:hypothetical protein
MLLLPWMSIAVTLIGLLKLKSQLLVEYSLPVAMLLFLGQ